jgi:hypothetical protein
MGFHQAVILIPDKPVFLYNSFCKLKCNHLYFRIVCLSRLLTIVCQGLHGCAGSLAINYMENMVNYNTYKSA